VIDRDGRFDSVKSFAMMRADASFPGPVITSRLELRREGKNFEVKHAYFDNTPCIIAIPKKPPPIFRVTSPKLSGCTKWSQFV
jgi:hypothetical protein